MVLSRRQFSAALASATLFPTCGTTWAASKIDAGESQIDVVSDGKLTLPGSFLYQDLPKNELDAVLAQYGLNSSAAEPDCNLTVFRDGKRTVIFDAGAGPNFMSSAGKLGEALDAIGLDPSSVTHVVFTHAHPDHLWGLLDDFDEPFFSNAEYMISNTEWDYWLNPKTIETIGEARQSFAAGAARLLKSIEGKITIFKSDEEILPGINARATHGHTPGHTSFQVKAGNEQVMVVGDAIGNHHIAFEKPAWEVNSDQDKSIGAKARTLLLDQLASEKIKMIGYHLPYPGIGYAEKKDGAYRFVAA